MFLEKRIASFRGMYVVAVERLDQRVPWQLEPLFHRRDALVSVDQRVLGGRDLGIGEYFGIDDQIGAVLGLLHGEGSRPSVVAVFGHEAFSQPIDDRSEEHTSERQSLMRISYAVFCLKNNTQIGMTAERRG